MTPVKLIIWFWVMFGLLFGTMVAIAEGWINMKENKCQSMCERKCSSRLR